MSPRTRCASRSPERLRFPGILEWVAALTSSPAGSLRSAPGPREHVRAGAEVSVATERARGEPHPFPYYHVRQDPHGAPSMAQVGSRPGSSEKRAVPSQEPRSGSHEMVCRNAAQSRTPCTDLESEAARELAHLGVGRLPGGGGGGSRGPRGARPRGWDLLPGPRGSLVWKRGSANHVCQPGVLPQILLPHESVIWPKRNSR